MVRVKVRIRVRAKVRVKVGEGQGEGESALTYPALHVHVRSVAVAQVLHGGGLVQAWASVGSAHAVSGSEGGLWCRVRVRETCGAGA